MGYFDREASALQNQLGACANLEWGPARAAIVEAMKKVGRRAVEFGWYAQDAGPDEQDFDDLLSALDAEKEEGE